jgi:hypothetical protein
VKLQEHLAKKKENVRGWDILSAGLGITGFFLISTCLCQPKAKINAVRLPAALVMMMGSCVAERLRESDLLSLDKAVEFNQSILSEKIRRHTLLSETIDDLQTEDSFYDGVPQDRWMDLAERTGIAPPNLEARQALMSQSVAQTAIQTEEPAVQTAQTVGVRGNAIGVMEHEIDPAIGYDPEYDPENASSTNADVWADDGVIEGEEVQDCLIFAVNVPAWFKEKAGLVPSTLIAEWLENPGIAIKVEGGQASIVRSQK